MSYPNNPEVIATVETIDTEGENAYLGDRIVGIQVRTDKQWTDGVVDIDVRKFDRKGGNLVLRIALPELMAALSRATSQSVSTTSTYSRSPYITTSAQRRLMTMW